ncbi:amidohydrolase family protein [Anaerovibrio lipolyticus]|uniref:amidohydrolase family protein n=1 Tax=Anaerovibrio lipolyticus TaxID=82374 RepID=UPI0026E94708|nr:amidohydrolase family protein [Anaerovibrio lipolyticus]MBE6105640.1 amidohydrolase [Anaerovibrio lipolyticus]
MKRRDFLKLTGVGMLSAMVGNYGIVKAKDSGKEGQKSNMSIELSKGRKVDFHCHAILPSYINGMKQLGIDAAAEEGFPLPKWTLESHLQFMADAHIDYSVLSMPTPHVYNGDEGLSAQVSRAINEEMAELCHANKEKFGFVATMPLPSVDKSIKEIRYAVDELGALGVKVASNSNGVYLGDPCMDDIFAELNRRRALVIIHPSPARTLPRENVVTGRVMALFEYPADTTRAVLNLLANGTLDRYPNIRLVVPHTGSFIPYMKQRAKAMFQMLATLKMMEPVDIDASIGRLYFDLAGDPMPEEMEMLLSITDKEHIVYGSDYPYVLSPILLKKKEALDGALTARNWMNQVYVKNAALLLKN